MDPKGNIYESENVPPEDKARLDGYLKARAEQDELKRLRAEMERMFSEQADALAIEEADDE